jgi:hypothetical protein
MNPLSDWFVDAEVVAQHQQRLLDSVASGQCPPDDPGATAVPRAPRRWWRWSCWLKYRWNTVSAVVAPVPRAGSASSAAAIARISVAPSQSTAAPTARLPSGVGCRGYRRARRGCA